MAALPWMDRPTSADPVGDADFFDVARFGVADTPEQVAAALSCMACLGAAVSVVIELVGQLPFALCRCGDCHAMTAVELEHGQARRLVEDAA